MPERLFRIVLTNPPTEYDFRSKLQRGELPPSDDPEVERVSNGLSMFDSLDRARKKAKRFPILGAFVAEVSIPGDTQIRIEQTFGRGHYTVWGEPQQLLSLVSQISAVEG